MSKMSKTHWTLFQMQNTGEGTDCFFVVNSSSKENALKEEKVYAHRFMLIAASSVFKTLIDKEGKCIQLKNVQISVFKKLLR